MPHAPIYTGFHLFLPVTPHIPTLDLHIIHGPPLPRHRRHPRDQSSRLLRSSPGRLVARILPPPRVLSHIHRFIHVPTHFISPCMNRKALMTSKAALIPCPPFCASPGPRGPTVLFIISPPTRPLPPVIPHSPVRTLFTQF